MGMVSDVNFAEMAKTAPVQESAEVMTADLKSEVMLGEMESTSDKANEVK